MTSSLLGDAFAHHLWASERLLDACGTLSRDQLLAAVPGTYGSIIATLGHLVASDRWYLSFFPTGRDLAPIEDDADTTYADLQSAMTENATAWTELLAGPLDPDAMIDERDEEWLISSPVGVRLAQALHHGTDHRSQVCTALTSLGITPPEIDVWAYARATGRERAVRLSPNGEE